MSDQFRGMRVRLVHALKAGGWIRSPRLEAAFLDVPRHIFLPKVPSEDVYTDRSFPTKHRDGRAISSSSQPAIMAVMLEQLGLQAGQRVLEIGAGTGYNAALMAHLVGNGGKVVTMDIDDDLVDSAREHLADGGFSNVEVIRGDGGFGHSPGAPYDRIILTVGAWDIAPAWVEQLASHGRLVLPLSIRGVQKSVAFEPRDEHLESVSVADCGFMTLRGALASPERLIPLGPSPGPYLSLEDKRLVDADTVFAMLSGPAVRVPTEIEATVQEAFGSLSLWLALEDPDSCFLGIYAEPSVADGSPVPLLAEWPAGNRKQRSTVSLLGKHGLVALARSADDPTDREASAMLSIVSFGDEPDLIRRMQRHLQAWDSAARPKTEALRIRAYPKAVRVPELSAGSLVEKRWTTLLISLL